MVTILSVPRPYFHLVSFSYYLGDLSISYSVNLLVMNLSALCWRKCLILPSFFGKYTAVFSQHS